MKRLGQKGNHNHIHRSMMKYAYEEPKQALSARIQAHQQYSNFSLHDWLKGSFELMPGHRVFDLGCGDGNYTRLFWDQIQPSGFYLGLDKNIDLINEAKNRFSDLPKDQVQFVVHDFDTPLPYGYDSFDWVFAIYSLYYAKDSLRLIYDIREKMTAKGCFVVIGPGPDNIKDLWAFNYRLIGEKGERERVQRIAGEFIISFEQFFPKKNIHYEEINSEMRFPTAEAFAEYYWSTLLWRESVRDKSSQEIDQYKLETLKRAEYIMGLRIKKQISVLIGKKG
ncbi:MAG: methyltransferase domain-containing protein [Deltaproteobacteria bacterium]|nr:methyltransferase domain-containing protein [Deltaproteobacteria bacterium]